LPPRRRNPARRTKGSTSQIRCPDRRRPSLRRRLVSRDTPHPTHDALSLRAEAERREPLGRRKSPEGPNYDLPMAGQCSLFSPAWPGCSRHLAGRIFAEPGVDLLLHLVRHLLGLYEAPRSAVIPRNALLPRLVRGCNKINAQGLPCGEPSQSRSARAHP